MSRIPESYLEPLQWFSDHLKTSLKIESPEDARLVQKGLLLYRQGVVSQLKLEHDAVMAVVQDVTRVKVKLDLNDPYLSECTCPADKICRHQMAVFFQLLSRAGSVSIWVDDWRKPLREQKQAQSWGIQRAKDLLKSTGAVKLDYQAWINSFNESFEGIMFGKGNPKPYIVSDLYALYIRRLKASAPFETEWKNLYLLIGYVITFKNLLQLTIKAGHDEESINRYYRHLFEEIIEMVEGLSTKLSVLSLPFAFDEFIIKLKDETLDLIDNDFPITFDRIYLYRVLWTNLFRKKSWREEVKEKLSSCEDITLAINVGLIHMHILLLEDEKALSIIKKFDEQMTPYLFYWIEYFSNHKEWQRAEPFVAEFIGRIKAFLNWKQDYYANRQFMLYSLKVITPFCTEYNRLDLYEKALIQTLPYSFRDYEYFLFDQKQYEKWMELQTFIGLDFDSISKEQIKLLQTEAPSILLPIYHQAIQGHIDGKNREQYRQAVRKLKKLRTIYKKLKLLDDWDQFFNLLLTRTKRLRAFHEECKRGKLIDV